MGNSNKAEKTKRSYSDFKVVLVGDVGSGNTSLMIAKNENRFPKEYVPTVADNFEDTTEYDDENLKINFWDTATHAQYGRIRSLAYPRTDLFILSGSVTNPNSFTSVQKKWIPEIRENCPDAQFLVLGTKIDLREDEETMGSLKSEKLPTLSDGIEFAAAVGAIGYLECSALTADGFSNLFEEIYKFCVHLKHFGNTPYSIAYRSNAKSARK